MVSEQRHVLPKEDLNRFKFSQPGNRRQTSFFNPRDIPFNIGRGISLDLIVNMTTFPGRAKDFLRMIKIRVRQCIPG
jgi:hypothetical protein